ncbi:hypothetical protein [Methylobacterium frigidaeris]|uniref:Uncharacterized protein n=1 Tax=Methylobacterium frigidaeris TaxID=2038277 RepID=A0AA37HGF6_9HYPH|nr:hypothetical protein [Methylobacterium frigidaeris]GJD65061.1 hypothetical protein MPEAHAMD_5247 [Methylobacterium frigidaeris]
MNFAMRWLSLLVLVASIYTLIIGRIYKNIPISVISTIFTINFEDEAGQRVQFDRKQLLRANQTNVTAYFFSARPTSDNGIVVENSISGNVFCHGRDIKDSLEWFGTEKKGFEIIHNFGRSLPYAWYMPLIPIWILNRESKLLFGFIRSHIMTRRVTIRYENEFNNTRPTMKMLAGTYSQHNITIILNFHKDNPPTSVKAIRIKENGVLEVGLEEESPSCYKLYLPELRNEILRLSWVPDANKRAISSGLVQAITENKYKVD